MLKRVMAGAAALLAFVSLPAAAQNITAPPPPVPAGITVEEIKVHGASLVGNLEGNAVDREVMVVLPPSYKTSPNKRYPVVYYLHGFAIDGKNFYNYMHVPEAVAHNAARGDEFIVVVPSTLTKMGGSMYSSSVTTGDFERYIAHDVVAYIDSHYRTIPARRSRGLVGHSMGGYGATRIGMKHPDVFGSLYIMSPCCLSARRARPLTPENAKALAEVKTAADAARLPGTLRSLLAGAAAWSPNPKNPPLYVDLPYKDSVLQDDVLARWAANAPLSFVDQYIGNLRQYNGIAIDVGDQDGLRADAARLHDVLDRYGLAHTFEVYTGTHTSAMGVRFQNFVMPFFSQRLCTTQKCE